VKPDKGDFIVVYKDIEFVSSAITSRLKAGVDYTNTSKNVRLNAKDVIGTVRKWLPGDPMNRSWVGLHVTFVKSQYYGAFATSTKKDNSKTLGSRNPASYFIDPCGAGSPVSCH
jgi:hypothetical protein